MVNLEAFASREHLEDLEVSRPKSKTQIRREAIFADYLGGMSAKQVAEKWGYKSRNGVYGLFERWGLTLPPEEYERRIGGKWQGV